MHLSLGATNSQLTFDDNGLVTLDTPTPGTGALVGDSTFFDNNNTGVTFDFSGLNGPNAIVADRSSSGNQADTFTLGNFGSDLTTGGKFQTFTFVHDTAVGSGVNDPLNTATFNFGSGAYSINDAPHTPNHAYVNTAPNGTALGTLSGTSDTPAPFALIGTAGGTTSVITTGDTLLFKGDNVSTFDATPIADPGNVAAGVAAALLTLGAHEAGFFTPTTGAFTGDTFVFDHANASLALSASDALVGFVGVHATLLTSLSTGHVLGLTA